MTCSQSRVFCDWLTVSFRPDDSPLPDVCLWLDHQCCPVRFSDDRSSLYDVGGGTLRITFGKGFHSFSVSGVGLMYLRNMGLYSDYLSVLASCPHNVTRLDAACDYPIDGPVFLRRLEGQYPADLIKLQRKAIRVTRLYSSRLSDGQLTGTWYAGHKSSARVTARVYDKQAEALDNRGESLPPTTRVEFTFSKDHGCTLRDAYMPYSLYHQYASPSIVPVPSDAEPWVAHGEGWDSVARVPPLPIELFKRRVELSPEIARLVVLAASYGAEGDAVLLRAFQTGIARHRLEVGSGVAQPDPVSKTGS